MEDLVVGDGAPVRIVYEFQAHVEPAFAGTIISAFDGDRFSARTEINGMSSLLVGDGDEVVTCMQVDEWQCFGGEQPEVDTDLADEVLVDDPADEFGDWTYTGGETIAERDAACGTAAEADVCFDRATGMALRIVGPEMEMHAVEVGSPSSEDFELPAEPGEGGVPGIDPDDLPDGFDLDDLPEGMDPEDLLDDLPEGMDLEDLLDMDELP